MRTWRAIVLLVALIALAGCAREGGDPSPAAEATASSTASAVPAVTSRATSTGAATTEASPSATPTSEAASEVTSSATPAAESPTATPTATPTSIATQPSTPTVAPSPTDETRVPEIRATHLRIPKLAIDAEVQGSQIVPYTGTVPEGCPAPTATTTLTVPSQGIATPEETWQGIERKSWIYGHSRWQGAPGLFFSLPGLSVGDELFVDGFDRVTGDPVSNRRFVVDGLYLADTESGGTLVNAQSPDEIPSRAQVILQTSVRERGVGKAWILDRDTLLAKAETRVDGDLDDPCKYLLFFVFATAA